MVSFKKLIFSKKNEIFCYLCSLDGKHSELVGFWASPARAPISNVKVDNIGSASQVGFTQYLVV